MQKISRQDYLRLIQKSPKYKNKTVRNALGKIVNHSKGENQFARDLYLELAAGKYKQVEEQVRFKLIVNEEKICIYIVDFLLSHWDNTYEIIEYKGKITNEWRIKWKLLQALFPNYKYTLVRHL